MPFAGGLLLWLFVDRLTRPQPVFRTRPGAAWLLHTGLYTLGFALELAAFQRPWFAAANVVAWQLLIVLISNAKHASLREPFLFQDFEYFLDAIKHPRLYLPFLGAWRAALAAVVFALAVGLGLMFEPTMTRSIGAFPFIALVAVLFATAALLLWMGARQRITVTFEANDDVRRLGLVATMWRYREEERLPAEKKQFTSSLAASFKPNAARPNIIVVQSESFFDVRRVHADIDAAVFAQWDVTAASAASRGRLRVAAWGANTVRTEFAFLSGISSTALGVHRFNPYRKLARAGIATIATMLKAQGYKTICVHPYSASFYTRNVVFPALGFDEFIDVANFKDSEKSGPYIGDIAVAKKITTLLKSHDQGVFIFAITMENHGPLHWEQVSEDEKAQLFTQPLPAGCADLAVYARHLRNADRMLGMLRTHCESSASPHWLCQYGDHVPIMPAVYQALGEPDGTTDYLIWGNRAAATSASEEIEISDLGARLLRAIRDGK